MADLVADRVFRELTDKVLSGRYAPGEKLPPQRTLASELGVNMAPVREAVRRLEQLGVVEVRHGDGMRVTNWRASGGLDVLAHVVLAPGGLDGSMLAAIMEARRLMLSEAARLAAERRNHEQAERLLRLAAAIAEEGQDAAAQALDFEFFAELVEASGNVVLVLVTNSIRRIYFQSAELFAALVADREGLAPLYERAARAVNGRRPGPAAAAVAELAREQERRLAGALR
jgi:GntR family transcriptional repressor for pyruvate dehydrogenase complex